jgi:subtilisin family serine protease
MDATLKRFASRPHVIGAEPNGVGEVSEVEPDDDEYVRQWHMRKIRADEAWVVNRGARVIVGVIDTGVDYNHPDLAGKVIRGRDFRASGNDPNGPMDTQGHGTHVAGTIAANTDNGPGVAGVSWNGRILAEKVFPDGQTNVEWTDLAVRDAIQHAVRHDARVLNLSIGGGGRHEEVAKALHEANEAQVVVVIAAGNDNCSNTKNQYPGAWGLEEKFSSILGLNSRTYRTSVLTVGATNPDDRRALFAANARSCQQSQGSNFGGWVELAAPGGSRSVPPSTRPQAPAEDRGILSTRRGGYEYSVGTSMAAPHVAGAAALLFSDPDHPYPSEDEVRARLMNTAVPLPGQQLGRGRLDVFDAILNGGFEDSLRGWQVSGAARSISSLGPVRPRAGNKMAFITTGAGAAGGTTSTMVRRFPVLPGTDRLRISLDYNYLTEEYPEFVGSQFNDQFQARIIAGDQVIPLASESVNSSTFTPITGIDFPGGDSTLGQTGWKPASADVSIEPGTRYIVLEVTDLGDAIYDSVALIDNIRFK